MKIAIMQPYLFPYIGYFSLIANTERFVFFDTPQYIRRGWINRNRIISCKNKVIYFNVPINKADRSTPINQIKIDNSTDWKASFLGQLTAYKSRAPYYNDTIELVHNVIDKECSFISKLAIDSIIQTSDRIGLKTEYSVFSEMNMNDINVSSPDEWALEIAQRLGYSVYVNPPGGIDFFNPEKYADRGIELLFLEQELTEYKQRIGCFVPGLSIIDVMMFCSPNEIRKMFNNFKFIIKKNEVK